MKKMTIAALVMLMTASAAQAQMKHLTSLGVVAAGAYLALTAEGVYTPEIYSGSALDPSQYTKENFRTYPTLDALWADCGGLTGPSGDGCFGAIYLQGGQVVTRYHKFDRSRYSEEEYAESSLDGSSYTVNKGQLYAGIGLMAAGAVLQMVWPDSPTVSVTPRGFRAYKSFGW